MTGDVKTCTKCGVEKPADCFYLFRDIRYSTGLRREAACKECRKVGLKRNYAASKRAGTVRAHFTMPGPLWAEFQALTKERGLKTSAAVERLVRAELEREAARRMLGAIRKVSR